jgi:phage-related baseplate assembly protein
MSDRFDTVNLSALPAPAVVEVLDFAAYKAAYLAVLKSTLADVGITWDMDAIEADPGSAMAESTGYREMLVRGRVNDAARAVMLAYATGTDLDNLAALYKVGRLAGEADDQLRSRTQIAPEALSVAGPKGAYVFHARQVSAAIVDVNVWSPSPGVVHVIPLVAAGNGVPDDATIAAVQVALNDDYVRPLTDAVSVLKARLLPATISASLFMSRGPDPATVQAAALASLNLYLAARRMVGATVYAKGIETALMVGGVDDLELASPAGNLTPAYDQVVSPAIGAVVVAVR